MQIPDITTGKILYCEEEGGGTFVHSIGNYNASDFELYLSELKDFGYDIYSEITLGTENTVVLLKKGNDAVYVVYYPRYGEMRIVCEPNCEYLRVKDTPQNASVKTLLTHPELKDYGQSSVIRLCDGRFIIIDGGWDFEPDVDTLLECLSEQTASEKPVIAAWIMTHPDVDHYRCCILFHQKYADKIIVERFIYNFPDATEENTKRLPSLKNSNHLVKINELADCVRSWGAQFVRAHTGQVFNFSNAKIEILSSPDDCYFIPVDNFNDISLVFKMTIENQTILWCGDANFEIAKLAERWGEYLKSDILQIPHHSFAGGRKEEYSLIDPKVCLLTGDEDTYFGRIAIYRNENQFLICDLNVEDWFMNGSGTYTLELPYTPRPNGRRMLLDKMYFHQKTSGAYSWFFDGLTKEDCDFVFVNIAAKTATIYADLYFDDVKDFVHQIKIEVNGCTRTPLNILDPNAVDPDAVLCSPHTLKAKGVAENKVFTVYFKSDVPVVIIGKKAPVYYY